MISSSGAYNSLSVGKTNTSAGGFHVDVSKSLNSLTVHPGAVIFPANSGNLSSSVSYNLSQSTPASSTATENNTVTEEIDKIDKIDGIALAGNGSRAVVSELSALLALQAVTNTKVSNMYKDEGVKYISGNSGGTWINTLMIAQDNIKEANEDSSADFKTGAFPIGSVCDDKEIMNFFREYWMLPISDYVRKHWILDKGITPFPTTLEEMQPQIFEFQQNHFNNPETAVEDVRAFFHLPLETEGGGVSDDAINKILLKCGLKGFINEIIDILKFVVFFLRQFIFSDWRTMLGLSFMQPWGELLAKTKVKDLKNYVGDDDVYNMKKEGVFCQESTVDFASFMRWENPTIAPWDWLHIFEFVGYEWSPPGRRPNGDDTTVLGCSYNQIYNFGFNHNADVSPNIFDPAVLGINNSEIVYTRRTTLLPLVPIPIIGTKRKGVNHNLKSQDVMGETSLLNSTSISSAAIGLICSQEFLVEWLRDFLHILPTDSPSRALAEEVGVNGGSSIIYDLLAPIMFPLFDIIVFNKTIHLDVSCQDSPPEANYYGGSTPPADINRVISNSALIETPLIPPGVPAGDNGVLSEKPPENNGVSPKAPWNRHYDSGAYLNATDGSPCTDNCGVVSLVKAIQTYENNKDKTFEIMSLSNAEYFEGLPIPIVGPCINKKPWKHLADGSGTWAYGFDTSFTELFGWIPQDPEGDITDNIVTRNRVPGFIGVPLPKLKYNALSSWIFVKEGQGVVNAPTDHPPLAFTKDYISWPPDVANRQLSDRMVKAAPAGFKEREHTAVRMARFTNVVTRKNEFLGIEAGWKFNITHMCGYNDLLPLPIPIGDNQSDANMFEGECNTEETQIAQFVELMEDDDLKGIVTALFTFEKSK